MKENTDRKPISHEIMLEYYNIANDIFNTHGTEASFIISNILSELIMEDYNNAITDVNIFNLNK